MQHTTADLMKTVYQQVCGGNMTREKFADFCLWLYNKGWHDGHNAEDDEAWVYEFYPEGNELYPEMER